MEQIFQHVWKRKVDVLRNVTVNKLMLNHIRRRRTDIFEEEKTSWRDRELSIYPIRLPGKINRSTNGHCPLFGVTSIDTIVSVHSLSNWNNDHPMKPVNHRGLSTKNKKEEQRLFDFDAVINWSDLIGRPWRRRRRWFGGYHWTTGTVSFFRNDSNWFSSELLAVNEQSSQSTRRTSSAANTGERTDRVNSPLNRFLLSWIPVECVIQQLNQAIPWTRFNLLWINHS